MGDNKLPPSGTSAATLIGLITVILIFYIIFLPPEVRIDLLEGDKPVTVPGTNYGTTTPEGNFLLKEAVGHLSVIDVDEKKINFPNFALVETAPDIPIREVNKFQVYNGWLSELRKQIPFSLPEGGVVSKAYVSFQASSKGGVLVVGLNGVEVYRGSMRMASERIPLAHSELEEKNQLTFHVEGSLFEQQEYEISDLKIIATVEEKDALISHNPFALEASEFESTKEGKLRFFISCDIQNVGYLTVLMNGKQLYSSVPVCDDLVELNIYKDDLRSGRNVLSFEGNKGVYDISKAELKLNLKETKSFLAYFNVNNQLYSDAILDKFKKIVLEMDFVDDKNQKELKLNINGYIKSLNQKDEKFELVLSDIQDLILPGRNYVEVTPLEPVDVVELRVSVR